MAAAEKKKNPIAAFFGAVGNGFKDIGVTFADGDAKTKLSYLIFGIGPLMRGQIAKGLAFLGCEAAFIWYMIAFGWKYLSKITTLGTVETTKQNRVTVYGDNSFLILLFGLLSIILILLLIFVWVLNIRENRKEELLLRQGKSLPSNKKVLASLLDSNFDKTLLSVPVLGIFVFTMLPILFMICIAFTNYDKNHQSPTNLFTWVGLENFRKLFSWVGLETFGKVFSNTGAASMGKTFVELVKWTLIWAVLATVLNYLLGMVVALMINKKGIKLKALWRTLFVVTVAVPQFVSLLLMSQMLDVNGGAVNVLLHDVLHWTPEYINFLGGDPWVARVTVVVVNIWVGIPYTILITSGILMNIPADLYESATIDGAGPVKSFFKITLPYMLFVTTPYLITSFVGNINNFNVIYLLTANLQNSNDLYQAGYTALLVTWLFKLTMNSQDYNFAAAIGILVFIVCATVSLLTFNLTKSAKNEEEFS